MNKKLLWLGTPLAVALPLVTVVSCGNLGDGTSKSKKESIKKTNKDKKIDGQPVTSNQLEDNSETNVPESLKQDNIKEDGFYLLKSDYKNGKLWNDDTLNVGKEIDKDVSEIKIHSGWQLTDSIMFGDGDSFYLAYDNDDEDGLKPDNLSNEFYFNDTSIAAATDSINKKLFGVQVGGTFSGGGYIPLLKTNDTKGAISDYVGSQSNHIGNEGYASEQEFNDAIKKFVEFYKDNSEVTNSILDYYGLAHTPDASGVYQEVKTGANHGFAPVTQIEPFLTYKKLSNRVFKFTWHISTMSITAAHLILKPDNSDEMVEYGSLSIGAKKEWDSYIRHSDAKYQAVKDIYLN